jgi:arylsulfatase A-like enzyme
VRIELIFASLSVLVTQPWSAAVAQTPEPPPNILLVVFDDLGYGDFEPYGGSFIQTPHVDALAAEGMRFTQFYSAAPGCSPARAALITGRHPMAVGIRHNIKLRQSERGLPLEVPTVAETLGEAGYTAAHFGKWHLGDVRSEHLPNARGFDHSILAIGTPYEDPELLIDGTSTETVAGHLTDITTDRVIAFMEVELDGPFFAQVWYRTPHVPLEPPARWASQYPDTVEGRYAAMVSHGDEQVGRLLAALDDLGIDERTLVLVTSDHGAAASELPTNGSLRGYKGDVYEGGIRVPLLVRWPGRVPAGSVNAGIFASVDLFPTFVELVGLETQGRKLEGQSMRAAMLEGVVSNRTEPLFWEARQPLPIYSAPGDLARFAVRLGPWKLVRNEGPDLELYHLGLDPFETVDLSSGQPHIVQELEREYLLWRHRIAAVEPDATREGQVVVSGDWLDFGGGALVYAGDSRLRFADGDFTFQTRIFPRSTSGDQMIAEHPGGWELRLDEGRPVVRVFTDFGSMGADAGAPLVRAEGTDVAFTVFGHQNLFSCVRLYVDGGLQNYACARGVSTSDERLRLGNDASGQRSFDGLLWSPELRRNVLFATELVDRDRDGVVDVEDSCIGEPNSSVSGANDQLDVDGDGFGNLCDGDFDDDGVVGFGDFEAMKRAFGSPAGDPDYDLEVDLTGDGLVAWDDLMPFVRMWGRRPGPSGIACGGALDCP